MEKEFNPLELKMIDRMKRNGIEILYDLWLWHFKDKYSFYQYLRHINFQLEKIHEEEKGE